MLKSILTLKLHVNLYKLVSLNVLIITKMFLIKIIASFQLKFFSRILSLSLDQNLKFGFYRLFLSFFE